MASISERSTKAEILAALRSLQDQQAQGPSWGEIWAKIATTARTVSTETSLLIRDTYQAGRLSRQWVAGIVNELSRPVLRSKA